MEDTPRSQPISTQIQAIAEQAIAYPAEAFTTLVHRIDVEWLREAYRQTNKSSAAGIDGITSRSICSEPGRKPAKIAPAIGQWTVQSNAGGARVAGQGRRAEKAHRQTNV